MLLYILCLSPVLYWRNPERDPARRPAPTAGDTWQHQVLAAHPCFGKKGRHFEFPWGSLSCAHHLWKDLGANPPLILSLVALAQEGRRRRRGAHTCPLCSHESRMFPTLANQRKKLCKITSLEEFHAMFCNLSPFPMLGL